MPTQGLQSLRSWLRSHQMELALSVRVTAAALASLVIALALQLKLPLWSVLTSIIATQLSVGRSLKTTRDYLIGTLGGAAYGGAVAILVPHTGEGALLFVLLLAVAPLAFVAALNPAYNTAERFFSLGFSLEQMRFNLDDLDRCVAEWTGKTEPSLGTSS